MRDGNKVPPHKKAHVDGIKKWIADNENVNCDEAFDAPPETKKGRPAIDPRVLSLIHI